MLLMLRIVFAVGELGRERIGRMSCVRWIRAVKLVVKVVFMSDSLREPTGAMPPSATPLPSHQHLLSFSNYEAGG